VRPWSADEPFSVSVLLHELVHHRQAEDGHWYCSGAQELPAYKLQQAWLDRFGLKANINWVAVLLESGCTPKDIYPDKGLVFSRFRENRADTCKICVLGSQSPHGGHHFLMEPDHVS